MTTYGVAITNDAGANFVRGDAFGVNRTITDIASGRLLTKAYLTAKALPGNADPGVFQLTITAVASSAGQITNTGASGTGSLVFTVTSAQSALLDSTLTYVYDIKVIYDDGEPVTVEVGTIDVTQGVTAAVA